MLSRKIAFLFAVILAATAAQAQQPPLIVSAPNENKTAPPAAVEPTKQPDATATDNATSPIAAQNDQTAADSPNTSKTRYKLQPSDVLSVTYRFTPEYNSLGAVVQPDGYVSLNLLGNVRVAGKTLDEVREKIKSAAAEQLNDPEVTVVLQEFVKPYFVVSGEVPVPGRFDLRDNTSALQAVLLAGGFKDSSRSGQVLLLRRYNAEVVEVIELKLDNLAKNKKGQEPNLREDELLQSGDMIYVPRSRLSKLERFVKIANAASVFGFILR